MPMTSPSALTISLVVLRVVFDYVLLKDPKKKILHSFKQNMLKDLLLKYTIYMYIYILQQRIVVTISLGGFVADQMRYNLESAQYL